MGKNKLFLVSILPLENNWKSSEENYWKSCEVMSYPYKKVARSNSMVASLACILFRRRFFYYTPLSFCSTAVTVLSSKTSLLTAWLILSRMEHSFSVLWFRQSTRTCEFLSNFFALASWEMRDENWDFYLIADWLLENSILTDPDVETMLLWLVEPLRTSDWSTNLLEKLHLKQSTFLPEIR